MPSDELAAMSVLLSIEPCREKGDSMKAAFDIFQILSMFDNIKYDRHVVIFRRFV